MTQPGISALTAKLAPSCQTEEKQHAVVHAGCRIQVFGRRLEFNQESEYDTRSSVLSEVLGPLGNRRP